MTKKLRDGLIDPKEIPHEDVPDYMADTYRGYVLSIKERIEVFERNQLIDFGYRELNEEFFALQCRLIMELIAFMVSTFHQSSTQPIGKSKRSENNPLKIIASINQDFSWPRPADPKFEYPIKENLEVSIPHITFPICDYEKFKIIHGKLGSILHEQQRPRIEKRTISLEEIFNTLKQLKLLVLKHLIVDKQGNGWYIDATMKEQPRGIGIIRLKLV